MILAGQAATGSPPPDVPAPRQPSFWLRLLASTMRRFPTDIRRVDMVWHALYRRMGGGPYTENPEVDCRWPAGLQPGVRGKLHGQIMFLNLQDWSDRRAYFSGRYYQQEIDRLLLSLLQPGDQYLDIGANIGMTTLAAASRIGPTGRGFAFEPNPVVFARLARHIETNRLSNIEAVPAALSNCQGTAKLFLSGSHTGLSSLSQRAEGNTGSVEVTTYLGDDFADRLDPKVPTILKIDVEGFEVQAFEGMPRILSLPEVCIIAEVSDQMLRDAGRSRKILHDHLQANGYQPYTIELVTGRWSKRLVLRRIPGEQNVSKYDALFVRPSTKLYRRIEPFLVDYAKRPAVGTS